MVEAVYLDAIILKYLEKFFETDTFKSHIVSIVIVTSRASYLCALHLCVSLDVLGVCCTANTFAALNCISKGLFKD